MNHRAQPHLAVSALLVLLTTSLYAQTAPTFDQFFRDKTMRVDYFHTAGKSIAEIVALDDVVSDGPWAGSRTRMLDETNLGDFFLVVLDRDTNRQIYSRGFSSIFGEWITTPEAKTTYRTFHESLRFPWPKHSVHVVLQRRNEDGAGFHEIWDTVIDPDSRFVNRADLQPAGKVWSLIDNGPPSEKVDILLLSEGYTAAELPKFHADAKRLVDALFREEPFKSRRKDFNVRGMDVAAGASGGNRPQVNEFRRTVVGTSYNTFDSERYVLTLDNKAFRNIASGAPYEFVEILVNSKQYGGGGIYNDQATAAVDTAFAEYVFVHEFGHHFADLADEYYTSDVAYETGASYHQEPWQPNATALHDSDHLKWKDLVDRGTPIPTPWDKQQFEEMDKAFQKRRRALLARKAPEAEVDALFREGQAAETKLLGSMKYSGKVGAFEGANYETTGEYRPEADCIMFTRDEVPFCRVCQRAITNIIDLYSRP